MLRIHRSLRLRNPDLIVWPESPAPFYTTDPAFRDAVSNIAREAQSWMLVGSLGVRNAGETPEHATQLYNSASLVSPGGEWMGRYDKIHLVPFGEYVPFQAGIWFCRRIDQGSRRFFRRALRGRRCRPEAAGSGFSSAMNPSFPDEMRQLAANGARFS